MPVIEFVEEQIKDLAITAAKIANTTITAGKVANTTLTATQMDLTGTYDFSSGTLQADTPSADADVATKAYVDGAGGSGTVTSITLGADDGSGTAITSSGTFTFTGGTDIATSVSGKTVTIASTGGGGGASADDENLILHCQVFG